MRKRIGHPKPKFRQITKTNILAKRVAGESVELVYLVYICKLCMYMCVGGGCQHDRVKDSGG